MYIVMFLHWLKGSCTPKIYRWRLLWRLGNKNPRVSLFAHPFVRFLMFAFPLFSLPDYSVCFLFSFLCFLFSLLIRLFSSVSSHKIEYMQSLEFFDLWLDLELILTRLFGWFDAYCHKSFLFTFCKYVQCRFLWLLYHSYSSGVSRVFCLVLIECICLYLWISLSFCGL